MPDWVRGLAKANLDYFLFVTPNSIAAFENGRMPRGAIDKIIFDSIASARRPPALAGGLINCQYSIGFSQTSACQNVICNYFLKPVN